MSEECKHWYGYDKGCGMERAGLICFPELLVLADIIFNFCPLCGKKLKEEDDGNV